MSRTTHARPTEYGRKARKAEGRELRSRDRAAAIAEGLAELEEDDGTITAHEFHGTVNCDTCAAPEHRHEFGPWDRFDDDPMDDLWGQVQVIGDRRFVHLEGQPLVEVLEELCS